MSLPCLPTTSPKNENVTVFVSSSSFCIVPSLFKKVEKLKWQQRKGFLYLNANADVFELLLQFLMFQKLPQTTGLTSRQASELLKMIKPLDNMGALVDHINIFTEAKQNGAPTSLLLRLSSLKLSPKGPARDTEVRPRRASSRSSSSSSSSLHMVDETMEIYNSVRRPMATVEVLSTLAVSTNTYSSGRNLEHKDSGLTEDDENVSHSFTTSASIQAYNPFDFCGSEPLASEPSIATTKAPSFEFSALRDVPVEPDENSDPDSMVKSLRASSKALFKMAVKKIKDQQISRAHKNLVASEYVM